MSNYAVIEVGSSQERVTVGDKITVNSAFNVEKIIPILVSPRKGQLITDSTELKKFEVQLSLVKEIKSKKLTYFNIKINWKQTKTWLQRKPKNFRSDWYKRFR